MMRLLRVLHRKKRSNFLVSKDDTSSGSTSKERFKSFQEYELLRVLHRKKRSNLFCLLRRRLLRVLHRKKRSNLFRSTSFFGFCIERKDQIFFCLLRRRLLRVIVERKDQIFSGLLRTRLLRVLRRKNGLVERTFCRFGKINWGCLF